MRFTRLSRQVRVRIVDCFIADIVASQAARLLSVNRKTINTWYATLRRRLSLEQHIGPIKDPRVFAGYHERRIASRNGLFPSARLAHLAESKLRYQLKRSFKPAALRAARDLID